MTTWLSALRRMQQEAIPAVLVTVAQIQGSTPREPGARMVYSADQQFDTIGGGHLEWRAAQIARAMLQTDAASLPGQRRLERIALGPSLGQCCGGVVVLCFERIGADEEALRTWQVLEQSWCRGNDLWRAVPLDQIHAQQLHAIDGRNCQPDAPDHGLPAMDLHDVRQTHLLRDRHGHRWLLDLCRAHQPQVVLFGAGHVGAAIVKVLSTLPCRVLWVDEREDMFPPDLPAQIRIEATDVPNAAVDMAEPGAYYLVMTHSHALDQQLTERILKRRDVAWFGLIGSTTKRKQFEHRLAARGFGAAELERITCPIGIPGIYGKEPASIAIAVVAQLMQLWELRLSHPPSKALPLHLATHALDGRG
ncbi:xanthine dehydrogenase accessory protein XdhC [Herbaspirillum rubrisubalbicans]|uniref:xanthine dehydrogenase accessory protein XdhC n=1 Tax=Herbaspirillum rubrisubalbicans TaxID=80842 RepID=UPI0015595AF3|nr:xanthine dehydrogenase accessory protein XdhC [Herbaspirillum rubrisubalbicans]NQE47964.1 XdhC protein [Herbaspirillum rubrisubalbicans]